MKVKYLLKNKKKTQTTKCISAKVGWWPYGSEFFVRNSCHDYFLMPLPSVVCLLAHARAARAIHGNNVVYHTISIKARKKRFSPYLENGTGI